MCVACGCVESSGIDEQMSNVGGAACTGLFGGGGRPLRIEYKNMRSTSYLQGNVNLEQLGASCDTLAVSSPCIY
jgi:hypothetical protein